MITALEIGNIRVFEDFGCWEFPLTKLTALCGTNSAGKSTLIKSLLLLAQSLSPWESPDKSGQLRLLGPIVDLGSYSSFVSHQDVSRDITIALGTRDLISKRQARHLARLKGDAFPVTSADYLEYNLKSTFRFGVIPCQEDLHTLRPSLFADTSLGARPSWTKDAFLKEASFSLTTEGDFKIDWTVSLLSKILEKGREPDYELLIPGDYFGIIGGHTNMNVPRPEPGSYVRIQCFLRGLLPAGLWAKRRRRGQAEDEDQMSYFPAPPIIESICGDLNTEMREIHYIGPLRSPAKRFYLTTSDTSSRMDAVGDFLPYVLKDRSATEISYMQPGWRTEQVIATLSGAINSWLFYLRTGKIPDLASTEEEIEINLIKDVLLEFRLKSFSDESYALADSGFGYSQLLPIVVRGLIAELDDTVIIEQPELHLNPALQVRMAEFLASLALSGKNLIIETHSEHIVNTLRVLTAEDLTGKLSEEFTILYLDTEEGSPFLRHLEVDADGTVPEWPKAFMGEAMRLTSRLIKAQQVRQKIMRKEVE